MIYSLSWRHDLQYVMTSLFSVYYDVVSSSLLWGHNIQYIYDVMIYSMLWRHDLQYIMTS